MRGFIRVVTSSCDYVLICSTVIVWVKNSYTMSLMTYWLTDAVYDSDSDKAAELFTGQSIFSQSLLHSQTVYENHDLVREVWESPEKWTHTVRVLICIPE